jgi:hypothetical protein
MFDDDEDPFAAMQQQMARSQEHVATTLEMLTKK